MAAHAIPQNYRDSSDYIHKVVLPLLEKLARDKIIDAVDIFHEQGYFNHKDVEDLFQGARDHNINLKIHADEFSNYGGAKLAAKWNALSADHLLQTDAEGIALLGQSSVVATLLPGTGFFLGKSQANARKFLDQGAKVALASDYNPGSCHCDNLLLISSLSAPSYKLNLCELWASITLNASHALGKKNQGALIAGLSPRFSIFNTPKLEDLTYHWGENFCINADLIF